MYVLFFNDCKLVRQVRPNCQSNNCNRRKSLQFAINHTIKTRPIVFGLKLHKAMASKINFDGPNAYFRVLYLYIILRYYSCTV